MYIKDKKKYWLEKKSSRGLSQYLAIRVDIGNYKINNILKIFRPVQGPFKGGNAAFAIYKTF